MAEAMAYDERGYPIWTRVGLILPRKNGKTTMQAARALYNLVCKEGKPEVILAARTNKQAERLFGAAASMVNQSRLLSSLINVQAYKGEMHRRDGKGDLFRFSAESGALDGYNPTDVVADEVHAWETPQEKKAWAALVSGFGARKSPQLFYITTAGDPATREDSILGKMLDGGYEKGEVERLPGLDIIRFRSAKHLIFNHQAPSEAVEDWKLANPASWISEEFLLAASESDDLTQSQKLRYHAGIWAASEDDFIKANEWAALADREATAEALQLGKPVGLGMDGSRTYDTTALAIAGRTEDGRIAGEVRVFSARQGAPHHVFCEGGKIDFAAVEANMAQILTDWDVTSGAYDPRYLQRSADAVEEQLGTDNLAAVEPTSKLMRDALACFYRHVKEGTFCHAGDPVTTAHVLAAKAKQDENGWVIRKRENSKPIDALTALVLAVWRADVDGDRSAGWSAEYW